MNIVYAIEITGGDGEALITTSNPKIIPGVRDEEGWANSICQAIDREVKKQDLVSSLKYELAKLLYG